MFRRALGPLRISVLLTALCAATEAPPALAQPLEPPTPRMMDPIGGPSYWQGSADHLPSLPGYSEWHIIQHALTMPAVQALLQEAERRGYVRRPEFDRAGTDDHPRKVAAFLALEKPDFSPPPGKNGAPLIQVISVDVYGNPRTSTALAFVLVNEATHEVTTADEEPSMPGDQSVEIHDGETGGGGGRSIRLHPELQVPPRLKYCGIKFTVCSSTENAACVAAAFYPGPLPWQARVIGLVVCSILATGHCLDRFVDCMYMDRP